MKKVMNKMKIYGMLLLFLSINLKTLAQNTATLSGVIENPKATQVQLIVDRLFLNKKVETITSPIKDGVFKIETIITTSIVAELKVDSASIKLFIEPNSNLQQSLKETNIFFSGNGAEQNNFLKSFYEKFKSDFDDSLMMKQMVSVGVDAFEISIYENTKKENDYFKNHADRTKFSPAFVAFMQNTINYRYWNLLLAYPIINANRDAKILTVNALPTIMLDGFEKVKVVNEVALNTESYRQFLKYYVTYFTSQKNGFNKFTDYTLSAERKFTLANERLSGKPLTFWHTQFMVDECGRLSPFMIKKFFTELKTIDKDGSYLAIVSEVCGERMDMKEEKKKKEKQKEEKEAESKPDELDLTDVNGKHVSLNDFKGKVVYIDFWASWCGPCRGMMPHSKRMHASLTSKQQKKIVFLYISIDENATAWKKGIQDMGIEGINVISPGNWNAKVVSYFQISSIPRYMIMNKKGEIVELNAARPADATVLDKLLKYAEE